MNANGSPNCEMSKSSTMKKTNRILLVALFASIAALGLRAQTTPPTPPTTPTTPTTPTPTTEDGGGRKGPNEKASATAHEVHRVIAEYRDLRAGYLAKRAAALEALKAATGAEKAALAKELREEEGEAALGKQIREALKELRSGAKPTGGGS